MTFNRNDMLAAFNAVQNKDHWKGPIDAFVTADQLAVTLAAIDWYHGAFAKVSPALSNEDFVNLAKLPEAEQMGAPLPYRFRVQCNGYACD